MFQPFGEFELLSKGLVENRGVFFGVGMNHDWVNDVNAPMISRLARSFAVSGGFIHLHSFQEPQITKTLDHIKPPYMPRYEMAGSLPAIEQL